MPTPDGATATARSRPRAGRGPTAVIAAPAVTARAVALGIAFVALAAAPAAAFNQFMFVIPNGNQAQGRCANCHVNAQFGGEGWNEFGKDVLRQNPAVTEDDLTSNDQNRNYTGSPLWDAVLCGGDSDGDTQTNGQELGDPECTWRTGQTPPRTADISNPGDPNSQSADPTGVTPGEGEGEVAEGEGEGEIPPESCPCVQLSPTSARAPSPVVGLFLIGLVRAVYRRACAPRAAPEDQVRVDGGVVF